jgi:hypothetical protein
MPQHALLEARIRDRSLDLFLTTIVCDGVKGTLAGFADTFKGYFLDNPLEFVRLIEDLLNQGIFSFDPGNHVRVVVKVAEWRDIRDRKIDHGELPRAS